MKEVIFTRISEARDVPCRPWPQKFHISAYCPIKDMYEIRPLTFTGIVKGVSMNLITMSYWRFMRLLFLIGFLDVAEGEVLSWKGWRWCFWKERKRGRLGKG